MHNAHSAHHHTVPALSPFNCPCSEQPPHAFTDCVAHQKKKEKGEEEERTFYLVLLVEEDRKDVS